MSEPQSAAFAVILAAAGKGTRFNQSFHGVKTVKKAFMLLNGKPLWLHSAERFVAREDVVQIIIAVSPEDTEWFRQCYPNEINRYDLIVVSGGAERSDTVRAALAAVSQRAEYVAVHDAARPCITDDDITAVFQQAKKTGAALLASPVFGTLKRVKDDLVKETVDRQHVWEAQTPQVFRKDILEKAYRQKIPFTTDDSQLVETLGEEVSVVAGNRRNIKVTDQHDFLLAQWILHNRDTF